MATAEAPVKYVQIDGLVVMKIIKHREEDGAGGTDLVQGVLLGMVVDSKLEVTNCFPFPRHTEEEGFDEVQYQLEMMRNIRHVNIDHLHVGWYQSTPLFESFLNRALLDSQFNYQNAIEESVVLIYDPLRTAQGSLALKAYRLTPAAMQFYEEQDFSPDAVKNLNISFENMFEEIPVVIRNSHLMNAMLCQMEEETESIDSSQLKSLDLATSSVLEKNIKQLMECVDGLSQDCNKYFNYQRQNNKYLQQKQQYIQKREAENASRIQKGLDPLPDEDLNKIFKPVIPPARLDSLLISSQVSEYCEQLNQFSAQSHAKLFMAEGLQESKI